MRLLILIACYTWLASPMCARVPTLPGHLSSSQVNSAVALWYDLISERIYDPLLVVVD